MDTPTTPPPLFTPEALKDPHVQAKVRSWIARHGCLLDGHPSYTLLRDLMQIPDKALLGRYQPRAFYVTEAYLANLEGLPPEAIKRFSSTTESIKGQKTAVREIPADVAMRLTPLKRLLSDDLHLLEEHPTHTKRDLAIGKYKEESAHLPKALWEEATCLSLKGLETQPQRVGQSRRQIRGLEFQLPA